MTRSRSFSRKQSSVGIALDFEPSGGGNLGIERGGQRSTAEHADQETTLAATEEFDNRHAALISALASLNDRERRIFEARRLAEEPIPLKELAGEIGISRERVRQIGVCAFEKVQNAVKNRISIKKNWRRFGPMLLK